MSEQPKIAVFAGKVTGFQGDARLYQLHPPMPEGEYVVVSAISFAFDTGDPETLIFPANEHGEVFSFLDLPGSYRGGTDHARALKGAGYEIADVLVVHESAPRKAVES